MFKSVQSISKIHKNKLEALFTYNFKLFLFNGWNISDFLGCLSVPSDIVVVIQGERQLVQVESFSNPGPGFIYIKNHTVSSHTTSLKLTINILRERYIHHSCSKTWICIFLRTNWFISLSLDESVK